MKKSLLVMGLFITLSAQAQWSLLHLDRIGPNTQIHKHHWSLLHIEPQDTQLASK